LVVEAPLFIKKGGEGERTSDLNAGRRRKKKVFSSFCIVRNEKKKERGKSEKFHTALGERGKKQIIPLLASHSEVKGRGREKRKEKTAGGSEIFAIGKGRKEGMGMPDTISTRS